MRGLYIHIPFCKKKCAYCDFISYAGKDDLIDRYVGAVCKEMSGYSGEKIDTVFIGGGTPSLLSEENIKRLMREVRRHFFVAEDAEITMEANPGTLSEKKLCAIKEAGINRLSIGVQSFHDAELEKIGRIHNAKTAEQTILSARAAGFSNINIDLMFSLPNAISASLADTLERAIALSPEHISAYSLILEEHTTLYDEYISGNLALPSDEEDRAAYQYICRRLGEAGYRQYEISNFSLPGFECRHNLKYWDCREYIGVGAAAHSYYKDERFYNTEVLEKYINGEYREGKAEKITIDEQIKEFMIMGLRKTEGVSKAEFKRRFGRDISEIFAEQTERFLKLGLLEDKNGGLRLSREGINVSNTILCEFV